MAFLKLGSGRFGFGAEKKDESDLAVAGSLTAPLPSFLTRSADLLDDSATASFFVGTALVLAPESSAFRFFDLVSVGSIQPINPCTEPA